ncbi:hypothetical protein [Acuticoccus kandeliae]|uniref:hypothetical protein n=1 Tax=Acuticoccus kandeliae TaxID=2073160 RepID=UPI000D3E41D5|nr:hypothetical protein [Acuticoccus kandeliae]
MHDLAKGGLVIWHDIAPEHRDETLTWYDRQHHAERVAIPGFLTGRRYMALPGTAPELMNRYETTSPDVLGSEAYLDRLNNPTAWSLKCQPTIRNNVRTVFRTAGRVGYGEGGIIATIRVSQGETAEGLGWPQLGEALLAIPGIMSVELWLADAARTGLASREKELRGVADIVAAATLFITASGLESLNEAVARAQAGAWGAGTVGTYALAYSLEASEYHITS